jgi:nucleotide-binding universal stress UspA family protein
MNKVLACVDPRGNTDAVIDWAAWAAARLARHPLVAGLPVRVAMVAPETTLARQQLKEAQVSLQAAGATAETELVTGEPQQVLPELVKRQSPALRVMGAFGHSRLRQWLFGSTTTSVLRLSELPVLILR